jgi:hypothetical protein
MKAKTTLLSLLLLSAVSVMPAYANYFSDPRSGTSLNVGSAPSPTPEQLRILGDSYRLPPPPSARFSSDQAVMMEGRTVFGARGVPLGYVLTVDEYNDRVELQTPAGIAVSIPARLIADNGRSLMAPTLTRGEVRQMALEQTGRTVAAGYDVRGYPIE